MLYLTAGMLLNGSASRYQVTLGLGDPATSHGISNSFPNSPNVSSIIFDLKCGFSEKIRNSIYPYLMDGFVQEPNCVPHTYNSDSRGLGQSGASGAHLDLAGVCPVMDKVNGYERQRPVPQIIE